MSVVGDRMTETFDAERTGTGTKEWAEFTVNIQIGCANNCLYCYAADKAAKMYGGWCKREDWGIERLSKRAEISSYPARDGVVMFPSTHDITPFNLAEYIRVAMLMLEKGNRLLIVTKPRVKCVEAMLIAFKPWKDQIMFRFTIGTVYTDVSEFWEPGAPLPLERVMSLLLAHDNGFRTSVSIEPMLEGHSGTMAVVETVREFVTDTVWIGKMNKVRQRVNPYYAEAIERIEALQGDAEIMALYRRYEGDPLIRWKDSIKGVVARVG